MNLVIPVLFVQRQVQAETSQTQSSLPLEAPLTTHTHTQKPQVDLQSWIHFIRTCTTTTAGRHLTMGSETSGTMLHWILQPLKNRRYK